MKSLLYGVSCPLAANFSLIITNILSMGAMQGDKRLPLLPLHLQLSNFTAVTRQTVSGLLTAVPHPMSSPCFQRADQKSYFWSRFINCCHTGAEIFVIKDGHDRVPPCEILLIFSPTTAWAIIRLTRQSALYIPVFHQSLSDWVFILLVLYSHILIRIFCVYCKA